VNAFKRRGPRVQSTGILGEEAPPILVIIGTCPGSVGA